VNNSAEELILIDGPGAGKRVRFKPDWSSSYVFTAWPEVGDLLYLGSIDEMTFAGPIHTVYRTGQAYNLDRQIVRVGWCSGEPRPDPERLEYWIRFEPPIEVIAGADAWPSGCDFGMSEDQVGATIQAACRCGWKTEAVPYRRRRELMELVGAHHRVGMALTFRASGQDASAFGMDAALLGTHSIAEATRYEAVLNRATALGMSRERTQAIFDEAQLSAYSFDEAVGRLQHRVRLFEMYGYEALTVGDVLSRCDIRAQRLDPEAVLNRPRWLPDPLGRQFTEMRRDRQRVLVEAAIELTAQLGDVGGWPLERAMAVVMPHKEDSRR